MHQRILHDETTARDTEHHAQTPPEDQGACDDGLLGVRGRGEDGHEGAGELEALADGRGEQDAEVGGLGEVAAEQGEADGAEEDAVRAHGDGPLEAARVCDGEADHGAGHGGCDGGEDEAEAG